MLQAVSQEQDKNKHKPQAAGPGGGIFISAWKSSTRRRNYHKGRAAIRHYANLREPSDSLSLKL